MLARTLPRVLSAAAFAVLLSAALAMPSSAASAFDASSGASVSSAPETSASGSLSGTLAAQREILLRAGGLSPRQADQRLAQEAAASGVIATLRETLGRSFAGAWFEPGGTDLVVATTDQAALAQVSEAGVMPRLVSRDLLSLDRVMSALDLRADHVPETVTGWYIDQASNSVVVSATDPAAAEEFAAGLAGVRVEQVSLRPQPLAELHGGEGIESADGAVCSIGFAATSGTTRYIITAGHCTRLGGTWNGENGTPIGPAVKTSFPDNDFGLIEVTSPSWIQTALVRTTNGTVTVTGAEPAPVGATTCRSGYTTGYQCGEVEAVDQTVNYGSGDVVQGLTRTSACAEAGDSGGPFVSGTQAQGMLSGGTGSCFLRLLGGETFFQPVGEALSTYQLTLLTGSRAGSDPT